MGYPQFNLTTIQLPVPSSSMTKGEYKEAYGIDLDSIDIRSLKLVIFGKDKFPITQIVETEDGYEIRFNGRTLSIGESVEISEEAYDVGNSKPVYYHPIVMVRRTASQSETDNGVRFALSFSILDNNPVAYTLESLKSWIAGIIAQTGNCLINASGAYYYNNTTITATFIFNDGTARTGIFGLASSGGVAEQTNSEGYLELFNYPELEFDDRVNKIN